MPRGRRRDCQDAPVRVFSDAKKFIDLGSFRFLNPPLQTFDAVVDFSAPSGLLLSLFDSGFSVLLCSELCSLDSGSSRFIFLRFDS